MAYINDDHKNVTEGGNDTEDKVFLLSTADASNVQYGFSEVFDDYDSNYLKLAKGTAYVKS